jgi:hypothetical protein
MLGQDFHTWMNGRAQVFASIQDQLRTCRRTRRNKVIVSADDGIAQNFLGEFGAKPDFVDQKPVTKLINSKEFGLEASSSGNHSSVFVKPQLGVRHWICCCLLSHFA